MSSSLSAPREVFDYVRDNLSAGVRDPRHPWHWPALATVLDNRVVVLRAADFDGGTLEWYTDRRAEKMSQIGANPRVVLLFYHGDDRRQLRLYGRADEVRDDEVRAARWASVSPKARANYLTRHPPGTSIPGPDSDLPEAWPHATQRDDDLAFSNFCVMKVQLDAAGFLQLLGDGSALRCGWRFEAPQDSFCWKAP